MKHVKRISALFLSAFFVVSMLYQPASGHRSQPVEIYHRAWQLVKDNYYDANMSGKNWGDLEHKYDGQIHTNADAFRYIKAMLETLNDPYTRFLDPRAFQDENDAIDARIVGIGVNLQQKDQRLVVTRTIEGGPAETAGMRAKDEIVEIDGSNAVGITPEQAAEKIRGKAGTPVTISVKRQDDTKKFNIVRQEIAIHAVSTKFLEGGKIGQITLSTFISNDASKEFRAALAKTANCEGLIVDLRDNPGGLLSNALEIADMLLEKGTIVSTISRHGRHADVASGDPVTHQPIVVLVDEESASASEILAGALKDNGRAAIVGTRTYGKGLVQEINRLPGGAAIHITVSRYLTPDGSDINKIGVKPTIECKSDRESQERTAMNELKAKIAMAKKPVRTSNLSFSK
ncbi:MAG: peptidase S41 [Candidatus Melainabacteria bacterium]|nr:MAG: peptidase S41 [Candidatus Melainabacteria bacterium]